MRIFGLFFALGLIENQGLAGGQELAGGGKVRILRTFF
jgi:hypothetical protein